MALAHELRDVLAVESQAMVTSKWRLVSCKEKPLTTGYGDRGLYGPLDCLAAVNLLCSAAVVMTERRRLASKLAIIAYRFHAFSDGETGTVSAMLRNLVHQLASQSDTIFSAMTGLFNKCGSGSQQPSDTELSILLKTTFSQTCGRVHLLESCRIRHDLANWSHQYLSLHVEGLCEEIVTDMLGFDNAPATNLTVCRF